MAPAAPLALIAALFAPGLAGAEAPPLPACSGAALAGAEAGQGDYDATGYAGEMVVYARSNRSGAVEVVVEHCPSRNRMSARFPAPGYQALPELDANIAQLNRRIDEAFSSSERYSLADLAAMARTHGARARVERVEFESCGCRTVAARGF